MRWDRLIHSIIEESDSRACVKCGTKPLRVCRTLVKPAFVVTVVLGWQSRCVRVARCAKVHVICLSHVAATSRLNACGPFWTASMESSICVWHFRVPR